MCWHLALDIYWIAVVFFAAIFVEAMLASYLPVVDRFAFVVGD
jgi:hypothetical protein